MVDELEQPDPGEVAAGEPDELKQGDPAPAPPSLPVPRSSYRFDHSDVATVEGEPATRHLAGCDNTSCRGCGVITEED